MDRPGIQTPFLLWALAACLAAQGGEVGVGIDPLPFRPTFTQIATEEGLSQVTVYNVFQDRLGYLWFGTQYGLNRYDGFHIKVFGHVPFTSTSLSHNRILEIAEDHGGTLWVGTQDGLNRFDRATETFERYLRGLVVGAVYQDRSGRFWIGTSTGLLLFERQTELVGAFESDAEKPMLLRGVRVNKVFEDSRRRLWVATSNWGVHVLDPGDEDFRVYRADPDDPRSLSDDTATGFAEDAQGRVWIGTYRGVSVFDPDVDAFGTPAGLDLGDRASDIPRVQSLLIDNEGKVWIGTVNGLVVYDPSAMVTKTIRHRPGDPTSLPDDNIFEVIQDDSGLIWAGTLSGGACMLDMRHSSFSTYRHNSLEPDSLAGDFVYAFQEDPGGILWVGTDAGLDRLDRDSGVFTHLRHDPDKPSALPSNLIRSIHRDRSGVLWVGAIGGLARLDFDDGIARSTLYSHDPNDDRSLASNFVHVVKEARDGVLWVGTAGGLHALRVKDRDGGRFTAYRAPESISHRTVRAIQESSDGTLWIGTYGGGLDRLDPERGRIRSHRHDPSDPTSLSTDHVYSLLEDSRRRLWVGTYGGGLNLLLPEHREAGRFLHLFSSNGLPSDLVYGILEDESGDLWVSTTNGLCRIQIQGEIVDDLPSSVTLRRFDRGDGLQNTEFNAGAFERLQSGELVFGGVSGLTIFDPSTIEVSDYRPRIELAGLRILGQPVAIGDGTPLPRSLSQLDKLELSYRHRVFTIEFSALDFANPSKNRYVFRLDGFDDHWTEVDAAHRTATYTGLAPGSYRFRVKATNSDGLWTSEERTLDIVIVPPFWRTWWFRLFSAVVVAVAVAAGWSWRLRSVSRQRDVLEAEVAARTRRLEAVTRELASANTDLDAFASSVSHDLQAPLRSMRGFSAYLVEDHAAELSPEARQMTERIDASARRMEALIDALLTMSRMSRGRFHVVDLDLSALAAAVVEELRSAEPARSVRVEIEANLVDRGDETLVKNVLENLLGNAWKFTSPRPSARIRFFRDGDESARCGVPVYVVEDNGAGFDMDFADNLFKPFVRLHRIDEFQGTGVGLATVNRIIRRHGGRIWAHGEVDAGAELRFTLKPDSPRP